MKKLFIFLLFMIFYSTIEAQKREKGFRNFFDGEIYQFSIGLTNVKYSNLENALKNSSRFGSGFSLNKPSLSLGSNYLAIKNKFLFGDNFSLLLAASDKWPAYGTKIVTSVGFVNFGYLLLNKKGWMCYALSGLGYGTTKIKIVNTQRTTSIKMDDNNIIEPGKSAKFVMNNPAFESSLGIKKSFLNPNKKEGHLNGLIIGLDAGFIAMPIDRYLIRSGGSEELKGFPKTSNFQWYVRTTIGLISHQR